MSRGAVAKRPRLREIEGIPGTVEPGFKEHPIVERPLPDNVAAAMILHGVSTLEMRCYTMGPCSIFVGHEPAAVDGSKLWHLTISTPSRHPTWDEIKVARYRLLPHDICVAMMLPPPKWYVNVPEQDHVMQLWEVTDPRQPWTTG